MYIHVGIHLVIREQSVTMQGWGWSGVFLSMKIYDLCDQDLPPWVIFNICAFYMHATYGQVDCVRRTEH